MNHTDANSMHTSRRVRGGRIRCSCGATYPNGNDWATHFDAMLQRDAAIRLACGCERVLRVGVARTGGWHVKCEHGITPVVMIEGGQFYANSDIDQRLEVVA